MPQVFLSHSSQDDAIVTRLHDALEKKTGADLWVDHKNIGPGDNWQAAIDANLRASKVCLVALSPASVVSEEVTAEWRWAELNRRRILVAQIKDVPTEDIPSRLSTVQWVDLREDKWEKGISNLAGAIRLALDAPPEGSGGLVAETNPTRPRSPSDDIAPSESPPKTAPKSSRTPLLLGGGLIAALALAAVLVLPSLTPSAAPTDSPTQTLTEQATETPAPTDEPTPTREPSATRTPEATEEATTEATAEATAEATPEGPTAMALMASNVRSGDAVNFSVVGQIQADQTVPIIGVSSRGNGWLLVQLPNGRSGWIAPSQVEITGDTSDLPRVRPPAGN